MESVARPMTSQAFCSRGVFRFRLVFLSPSLPGANPSSKRRRRRLRGVSVARASRPARCGGVGGSAGPAAGKGSASAALVLAEAFTHTCFPPSTATAAAAASGAAMKIEKANAGFLTNFEVLDFLRSRGAKTDPMGCLGAVAASECKVYEYLLKTPACNQTRESIIEFVTRCEGFKLTNADKLNVINWRPSSAADAYAMIEECGRRFSKDERGEAGNEDERVEEFLELVKEVFPPPPPKAEEMTE